MARLLEFLKSLLRNINFEVSLSQSAVGRWSRCGVHALFVEVGRKVCNAVIVETIYEHAGGHEALRHFIDIFYSSVLADPVLQPLFGEGRPEHVDHLTAFEAESFGGPDDFTRQLGFAHLIDVHRGLKITEQQRRRFVELYLAAADTAGLPDDPAFREALRSHVEFGSQVARQNSRAQTEDQLHPLREVPKWTWSDR
jgi:hemoglobin